MSYTDQTQIVYRNVKTSALTFTELDGNLHILSQSIALLSQSAVLVAGSQTTSSVTLGQNVTISGSLTVKNGAVITGSLLISGSAFGNDFVLTSDQRLKTDISDLEDSLQVVNSLRPVSYVKNGKQESGFIAQEVQEVLPNAVQEGDLQLLYLSINQIVAHNTKAIQELYTLVQVLEDKVKRLTEE